MTEIKVQKLSEAKLAKAQTEAKSQRQRYPFAKLTEVGLYFDVPTPADDPDKKRRSIATAGAAWLHRNKKAWQLTVSDVIVSGQPMIRCIRIK